MFRSLIDYTSVALQISVGTVSDIGTQSIAGSYMLQQIASILETTKHAFIEPSVFLIKKPGITSSAMEVPIRPNISTIRIMLIFI